MVASPHGPWRTPYGDRPGPDPPGVPQSRSQCKSYRIVVSRAFPFSAFFDRFRSRRSPPPCQRKPQAPPRVSDAARIMGPSSSAERQQLSLEEIKSIQQDCFADDVDFDFEAMRLWPESDVRAYFERGGDNVDSSENAKDRAAVMIALGACLPNAPVPKVPPPSGEKAVKMGSVEHAGSGSGERYQGGAAGASAPDAGRIFCVSDLHTDHEANLEWCRALRARGVFGRDALIVAGDVTASHALLEETLRILVSTFSAVFYVPGNHDLWVKGRMNAGVHIRPKPINSLGKLDEILALCAKLGVHTGARYAAGAIIAPLYAWYHSSFDTEPDIVGWSGIPKADTLMMDFHLCTWPGHLSNQDDSIARHFDDMNDARDLEAKVDSLKTQHPGAPVITFSHFVPRIELNPEKRYASYPVDRTVGVACGQPAT